MGKTSKIIFPEVKKILIRSANWVGDAVMSLPAIASMRQSFPQVEMAILAKPWVAELFQNNPVVDRVILYENPGIHQGIQGKWRLARELKKDYFDLAVLLQNAFEAAFISYLARIPRRAGYDTDGRRLLLTHPVTCNHKIKQSHQIDYYLGMVESLSFRSAAPIPCLTVSRQQQEEACRMLRSLGVKETEEIVGLSPGATFGSAKQWFPERYGKLAEKIGKEFGVRLLIFGSAGDKEAGLRVRHHSAVPLIDLTGLTTLSQAMALIARCRLFITNDSGLMHVAAALHTPLIALFGSTNSQRTGPRGELCRVISKPLSCAPCMKPECPERRQCMEQISVDEVYEEVRKIWGISPSPHPLPRFRGRGWGEGGRKPVFFMRRVGQHRAVFLDRDGTICEEVGYIDSVERLQLIPRSAAAIKLLNDRGFKVVMVTNQSGVARGFFPEAFLEEIHAELRRRLQEEGAHLDGIYYCPHHPDEGKAPYLRVCDCRKPASGLLLQAARDLGLDLPTAYVIGDHFSDVECAQGVGAQGILLLTGHGRQTLAQKEGWPRPPAFIARDLFEAVSWILSDSGNQEDA